MEGDGGCVCYLDCGDGVTGFCIGPNSSNRIHYICAGFVYQLYLSNAVGNIISDVPHEQVKPRYIFSWLPEVNPKQHWNLADFLFLWYFPFLLVLWFCFVFGWFRTKLFPIGSSNDWELGFMV